MSATGAYLQPVEAARVLLADCPSWRTWLGVSSQDDALAKTYLVAIRDPAAVLVRPWSILAPGTDWTARRSGVGSGNTYTRGGSIEWILEAACDTADPDASLVTFGTNVGTVIDELLGLAGSDGYLNVANLDIRGDIMRPDAVLRATAGDFWRMSLLIRWGL